MTIPAWMLSAVRDKQNGMSADQFKLLALVIANADEIREGPEGQRWAVYHGDLAQLPGAPSPAWFSKLRNRDDMLEKGYLAAEPRPAGQRGRSWTVRLTSTADLKVTAPEPLHLTQHSSTPKGDTEPRAHTYAGLTVSPSPSSSPPPPNLRPLLVKVLDGLGVNRPERVIETYTVDKCAYALSELVAALYDPSRRIETTPRQYVMGILLRDSPWKPVDEYSWLDHWFEPRERTA